MEVKLNESILDSLRRFNSLASQLCPVHNFIIDCSKMPKAEDFNLNLRKHGFFGEMFTELDKISSPCLYWFMCINESEAAKSKENLIQFRHNMGIHSRNVPAPNKNTNSKYLYLGIRQGGVRKKDGLTNIASRIFQHLGYYSVGSTQGLQLVHWAKLKLKLVILELPSEVKPYLNIFEKFYALKLRPVIGQH